MTNTHIHITRSQKLHLGNGKVRNCDTTNRWNDPGYNPGLAHLLSKGEEYINKNACQRCFAPNTAYGIIKSLAQ